MQIGKTVIYHDGDGGQESATVAAITGAGPSEVVRGVEIGLRKVLTLTVDKETVKDVPHANDRVDGGAFWRLPSDPDPDETEE